MARPNRPRHGYAMTRSVGTREEISSATVRAMLSASGSAQRWNIEISTRSDAVRVTISVRSRYAGMITGPTPMVTLVVPASVLGEVDTVALDTAVPAVDKLPAARSRA